MKKNSFVIFIILAASLYLITNFFIKHKNLEKKFGEITKNNVNHFQQENNFAHQLITNRSLFKKNNSLFLENVSNEDLVNKNQVNLYPINENTSKNNVALDDDLITKISHNEKTKNNFYFTKIDLIDSPIYENNILQSDAFLNDITIEINSIKEDVEANLPENNDLQKSVLENDKNQSELIYQKSKKSLVKETNTHAKENDSITSDANDVKIYDSNLCDFYDINSNIDSLSNPNCNFKTIKLFKIPSQNILILENKKENKEDIDEKITKNYNSNEKIEPKPSNESNELSNPKKRLSEIIIANNKYTKTDFLKKRIKIKPSDCINEKKLQEHLNFINLNPFRKVELIIDPKEDNYSDIDLICYDRFFIRPYLGFDNSGLKIIGKNRIYTGFDWNTPLLDSIFSYQYLASTNFNKFQSHTAKWIYFLPWENFLTLYASYAYIDVNSMPSLTKHHGSLLQTSLRYNICLPIINLLSHDLIFGFDFKRTDTNLFFSKFEPTGDDFVNLTQFLVSYSLNSYNHFYNTKLLLELYFSLGEMIGDQENTRYNNLRTFAKNKFIYAKGYFSNLIKLPKDFLIFLIFTGQISNENLLPSETFPLGGYNTVRGYSEREANTDSGFLINIELRTPSISFLSKHCLNDSFRFIVFFDYGYGSIHEVSFLENKSSYLMGFGPGFRYVINHYLTTRFDWGIKGKNKNVPNRGKSTVHFSINLSY